MAASADIVTSVLAILNLHVTQMPPTKFWLNLIYYQGADEV